MRYLLVVGLLLFAGCSSNKATKSDVVVETEVASEPMMEDVATGAIAKEAYMAAPIAPSPKIRAMKKSMPSDVVALQSTLNTEEYSHVEDNIFKSVTTSPLSTFSIDIDTASYAMVRNAILQYGYIPERGAVRTEEMINYFNYNYAEPKEDTPFAINLKVGDSLWSENKILQIGINTKTPNLTKTKPSNLVFLLDVSGSMSDENKLPLLISSLKLLTKNLKKEDRVAIVVYAGSSGLVLDSTSDRTKIIQALERLDAGGSTAGAEGIELAYKIAKQNFIKEGNNRIILATDGDFNVGAHSQSALVELIKAKRGEGIFLSILGFGMGNYKDNRMELLSNAGDGNYYYIDTLLEAKKVLVNQMAGTLYSIAKDVKIQVEFNPLEVKEYRLIGYENRMLNNEDFENDKKDAGEIGMGHRVSALYELVLNSDKNSSSSLKYQTLTPTGSNELATIKVRYKKPKSDTSTLIEKVAMPNSQEIEHQSFIFANSVAGFALKLRDSQKVAISFDEIIKHAKSAKGSDEEGYRAEFIKIVEKAGLLKSTK